MKKPPAVLVLFSFACKQKEHNAGMLVKNTRVYTADSNFPTAGAFVVSAGKIVAVGKANTLEEKEKGSIQPGKYAGPEILEKDIMKAEGSNLLGVEVLKTYINGKKGYEKK